MPKEPTIKTPEEAEELIRQGARVTYDSKENRIIIRFDGPPGKAYRIPYDEELYKRLKALYEEVKRSKREQQSEEGEEGGEPVRRVLSDVQLWNAFVQRRRPLLEQMIEKVAWVQEALTELGLHALIFSYLTSGYADPVQLEDDMKKMRTASEFVSSVMRKLIAMYSASRGQEEVVKLREKLAEYAAENAILKSAVERVTSTLEMYRQYLTMALQAMDAESLRKLIVYGALAAGVSTGG